jgi:ribosomal protein L11 methyltransferase
MQSLSEKHNSKQQEISGMREIRQAVRETIRDAETRLTLLDIERRLSRYCLRDRRAVRSVIRELVDQQELMYVSDFGHTFIEAALHKPIRITSSIILKPLNCTVAQGAGDVVVSLCHGTSFGSGQHPTTRLCLKGIEYFLGRESVPMPGKNTHALDIGTGSGVLIITAQKMGIVSGMGIDIDPCSVSEAQKNVECNGLSNCIVISTQPFDKIVESYDLILANLRLPTLKSFFPQMVDRTKPGGVILLSGIKSEERESIVKQGQRLGMNQEWMDEERGWAALGFQKEQ